MNDLLASLSWFLPRSHRFLSNAINALQVHPSLLNHRQLLQLDLLSPQLHYLQIAGKHKPLFPLLPLLPLLLTESLPHHEQVGLVLHDPVGELRAVDVSLLHGVSLSGTEEGQILLLHRSEVLIVDVNREEVGFRLLDQLLIRSEEFDEPSIDDLADIVAGNGGVLPLVVDVVPELQMGEALVGLHELLQNRPQSLHVPLQLPIYVVLQQSLQLRPQSLPVLKRPCHVCPYYPTPCSLGFEVEVLLESAHDGGSGEDAIEVAAAAEVTGQFLSDLPDGVLPDGEDHLLEEGLPVDIFPMCLHHHRQLPLPLMGNKSFPELFGIIVDVLREPHHDDVPDLIRFHFDVAVAHVGLIEAGEEPVLGKSHQWSVLPEVDDFLGTVVRHYLLPVAEVARLHGDAFEILDGDGAVTRNDSREGDIGIDGLGCPAGFEGFPDFVEE